MSNRIKGPSAGDGRLPGILEDSSAILEADRWVFVAFAACCIVAILPVTTWDPFFGVIFTAVFIVFIWTQKSF